MTCKEARQIDLVDYLVSLNYYPQKVNGRDYWYLSPLRDEKTPSFKVNRKGNVWYDHGIGKGGTLIDFGILYHKCSIGDLLNSLWVFRNQLPFSFHQLNIPDNNIPGTNKGKSSGSGKIEILKTYSLASKELIHYLQKRCIPFGVANRNCKEVEFLLYGKRHIVIGFSNNSGGFELRNEHFKGSSSPKAVTYIDNKKEHLVVFEGFFNYLSFLTLNQKDVHPQTNYLVLNSLSFFEKSRQLMEKHREVHLFLDRDKAGINHTNRALVWSKWKYKDRSSFYEGYKDLNDWTISYQHSIGQHRASRG
jgi:hypothetical protein